MHMAHRVSMGVRAAVRVFVAPVVQRHPVDAAVAHAAQGNQQLGQR